MDIKEAMELLDEAKYYYKLIVVNQSSLDRVKECKSFNAEKINMDEVLLKILENKTTREKEHSTWDFIEEYLDSISSDLLIIYNLDYLFSPDLGNLDIIKEFKYVSRTRKVILFVNGKLLDTHLIHSEEGYDDYRRMDISEVLVVGW